MTEGSFRVELPPRELAVALVRLTGHRGDRHLSELSAHVMRIVDGRTAEFWEGPTDQPAPDAFFGRPVSRAARAPRP